MAKRACRFCESCGPSWSRRRGVAAGYAFAWMRSDRGFFSRLIGAQALHGTMYGGLEDAGMKQARLHGGQNRRFCGLHRSHQCVSTDSRPTPVVRRAPVEHGTPGPMGTAARFHPTPATRASQQARQQVLRLVSPWRRTAYARSAVAFALRCHLRMGGGP